MKICLGYREKRVGKWLGPLKQHHENCSHSRYSTFNYCLFTLPSSKHLPPTTPHATTASNPIPFCTTSFFNSLSFYCTYLKTWAFIKWFKSLKVLNFSHNRRGTICGLKCSRFLFTIFLSMCHYGVHASSSSLRRINLITEIRLADELVHLRWAAPTAINIPDSTTSFRHLFLLGASDVHSKISLTDRQSFVSLSQQTLSCLVTCFMPMSQSFPLHCTGWKSVVLNAPLWLFEHVPVC